MHCFHSCFYVVNSNHIKAELSNGKRNIAAIKIMLLNVNYGSNSSPMCNFFYVVAKWSHPILELLVTRPALKMRIEQSNTLLQAKYAGAHKIDMAA